MHHQAQDLPTCKYKNPASLYIHADNQDEMCSDTTIRTLVPTVCLTAAHGCEKLHALVLQVSCSINMSNENWSTTNKATRHHKTTTSHSIYPFLSSLPSEPWALSWQMPILPYHLPFASNVFLSALIDQPLPLPATSTGPKLSHLSKQLSQSYEQPIPYYLSWSPWFYHYISSSGKKV
jgi:hypothetical protein